MDPFWVTQGTWGRVNHVTTSNQEVSGEGQKGYLGNIEANTIVEEQEMNDFEEEIFFTPLESLEKELEIELLMDIS